MSTGLLSVCLAIPRKQGTTGLTPLEISISVPATLSSDRIKNWLMD
ncbi:MAG: hypothetical protein IGR76_06430 [Synechococcales cyanobacterium T60_A2020_003]|nr:hypothetical protein [Synechococcales cyanobacterium T60_A2020_003]